MGFCFRNKRCIRSSCIAKCSDSIFKMWYVALDTDGENEITLNHEPTFLPTETQRLPMALKTVTLAWKE